MSLVSSAAILAIPVIGVILLAWELLRTSMPVGLGMLFTFAMRKFLGDTAPVVDIKSLSVKLWLRRRKLHAHLMVEGFGFGNPPGFPHKYFAACEELSLHAAMSIPDLLAGIRHIFNLLRTGGTVRFVGCRGPRPNLHIPASHITPAPSPNPNP